MILLTILFLMLAMLAILAIILVSAGGAVFMVIFADVIVCIAVVIGIIRFLIRRRK